MEVHPLKSFRENQQPPLSQSDLADLLGVARETVTRWESKKRKIDPEKLPMVSAKTDIPAKELRPDLSKLFEVSE